MKSYSHRIFAMGILLLSVTSLKAQFYSLRTNLLADATLNFNAEFSATLNRSWSVHLPLQVSPFVYDSDIPENRKFRNITFEPGIRYWIKESYNRGFIGIFGIASRFDACNLWDKYRYDGYAFGLGTSYGYSRPIAKRWNLEVEAGVGFVWATYDKYVCKHCGVGMGHQTKWRAIPARLSLSFVYLF